MSQYTRLASTDEQEESIRAMEKAFKKAGANIVGFTTIGKHPQTVILDVKHHGSEIYVSSEGIIKIKNLEFSHERISDMARAISEIKNPPLVREGLTLV